MMESRGKRILKLLDDQNKLQSQVTTVHTTQIQSDYQPTVRTYCNRFTTSCNICIQKPSTSKGDPCTCQSGKL